MVITLFCREFIVSQCRRNSWGIFLCIRKILVTKTIIHKRALSPFFVPKFFLSHSVRKTRRVAPQCFRNFRVSKKLLHKKWISRNSVNAFLSHSAEIFLYRNPSVFQKVWGIEKVYA